MGTPHVVNGAVLQCSFGSAPSTLTVLPINRMFSSHQPAATIMDHRPMVNIQPFAMCACPANPQVAAATAAAWGTLTPQPCAPMTNTPWAPGSPTALLANQPMLNQTSTCVCQWGGVVSVLSPEQESETIP